MNTSTICALLGASLFLSAGLIHAEPQPARTADAFVESIGICTDLGYSSGPYGRI